MRFYVVCSIGIEQTLKILNLNSPTQPHNTSVVFRFYKIHLFVHGRMYKHNYVEEREGVVAIYFNFTK